MIKRRFSIYEDMVNPFLPCKVQALKKCHFIYFRLVSLMKKDSLFALSSFITSLKAYSNYVRSSHFSSYRYTGFKVQIMMWHCRGTSSQPQTLVFHWISSQVLLQATALQLFYHFWLNHFIIKISFCLSNDLLGLFFFFFFWCFWFKTQKVILNYINLMYLKRSHFLCRKSIQTVKSYLIFKKLSKIQFSVLL